MAAIEPWSLKGELMLSCNCTVFCPCVLSLGKHPPTEGYCQTWIAIRIDEGNYGDVNLGNLNACLLVEIPGLMGRGNWTAACYLDERADIYAVKSLTKIFTGSAKGSTGLLSLLVGRFLGVEQVPITYETDGKTRRFKIPKIVDGEIAPVPGNEPGEDVVINNSQYWVASDIIVGQALKSKVRAHGRVWNFEGRSAEICKLDWSGP